MTAEGPALELHGARTGNCFRAAIALTEAGLAYAVRHVDLQNREQRSPAFLALNPEGKTPVLRIKPSGGGSAWVLTQSNAIILYAEAQAPGRLLPDDVVARTRALEAYFYFVTDVISVNGAAFSLRHEHPDAATALTDRYLAAIARSERLLDRGGFMGGDSFSMADIAGYTIVSAVASHLPWAQLPRLAAWREQIAARPAVVQGMAAFNPGPASTPT